MNKALEVLKDIRSTGCNGVICNNGMTFTLDEAIAELEEMLKPKSCDNCEFLTYYSNLETSWFECKNVKSAMRYNTIHREEIDTFGCNYHKFKEAE